MMQRLIKIVALTLVAVLMISSVGCYGSFELTKKVYKWNGTFGDKWVNEIGFLVLTIVPVYSIAAAIDVIILNSLEFWTGTNPAMASITTENGTLSVNASGDAVTLTDRAGLSMTVEATSDGAIIRSADGKIMARSIRNANGSVTVYDGNGSYLGSMSSEQIASIVR